MRKFHMAIVDTPESRASSRGMIAINSGLGGFLSRHQLQKNLDLDKANGVYECFTVLANESRVCARSFQSGLRADNR